MIPLALAGWAHRHGIPAHALAELLIVLRGDPVADAAAAGAGGSEAHVQSVVRLDAARAGVYLWRNNNGAMQDEGGRWVRFGLANDSPALNAKLKSHDLIGIRPVTITPAHVGTVIGQFVSRECKRAGWKYTGTDREVGQANWGMLVNSLGGSAAFATGPGTL